MTMRLGMAEKLDCTGSRLHDTRDALDEGGLAGAVLSDQTVDLALPDLEVDSGQRHDAGKDLDQTAGLEQGAHVAPRARVAGDPITCPFTSSQPGLCHQFSAAYPPG